MTAGILNLTIEKNADFSQTLLLKDNTDTALNLTGYTFAAMIKKTAVETNPLTSFTCTVSDPLTGLLTLSLTNAQTAAILTLGDSYLITTPLVYDIVQTVGGVKTRIVQGTISVSPGVTL